MPVNSASMRILSSSLQTTSVSGRRTAKAEPGALNWRKADTGAGYEAYLMDVFYETNPAYPVSVKSDTLILQDCSETGYKYTCEEIAFTTGRYLIRLIGKKG